MIDIWALLISTGFIIVLNNIIMEYEGIKKTPRGERMNNIILEI